MTTNCSAHCSLSISSNGLTLEPSIIVVIIIDIGAGPGGAVGGPDGGFGGPGGVFVYS